MEMLCSFSMVRMCIVKDCKVLYRIVFHYRHWRTHFFPREYQMFSLFQLLKINISRKTWTGKNYCNEKGTHKSFSYFLKDSKTDISPVTCARLLSLLVILLSLLSIHIYKKVIFAFFGLVIIIILFSSSFITILCPFHSPWFFSNM